MLVHPFLETGPSLYVVAVAFSPLPCFVGQNIGVLGKASARAYGL